MKDEYDFSAAKRGPTVPIPLHHTEIRLRLDTNTLDWLKERVNAGGGGSYQEMLNSILRTHIQTQGDAALSDIEIVEIAARYLKDKHPGGANLEALAQGVRQEQDWWYVPVRPSFEPPRQYEYYEALADAEGELEDSEHLTVLFMPTAPEESQK